MSGLSTAVHMRQAKSPAGHFKENKVTFSVASKRKDVFDLSTRDQNEDMWG